MKALLKHLLVVLLLLTSVAKTFAQGDEENRFSKQIHPDLNVEINPINDEDIQAIKTKLHELATEGEQTVESATIRIPDYKPAVERVQQEIAVALKGYFIALEEIDIEIRKFFSELKAIQDLQVREGREDLVQEAYDWIRIKKTPKVQAKIQKIYDTAVGNLYTLNGSLHIPVKSSRNQLKQKIKGMMQLKDGVLSICQTWMCTMNLARDLQGYFKFVESLNMGVSFMNFKKETLHQTYESYTPPLVSEAMFMAAKDLAKVGPRVNKEYTKGALVAKYFADIVVEAPTAAAIAVAALPIKFFEKLFEYSKKNLTGIIKISLDINTTTAYKAKYIEAKIEDAAREYAKDMPRVQFIHDDKEAEKIMIDAKIRARQLASSAAILGRLNGNDDVSALLIQRNGSIEGEKLTYIIQFAKDAKEVLETCSAVEKILDGISKEINQYSYLSKETYFPATYNIDSKELKAEKACEITIEYDNNKLEKSLRAVDTSKYSDRIDFYAYNDLVSQLGQVIDQKHIQAILGMFGFEATIDKPVKSYSSKYNLRFSVKKL